MPSHLPADRPAAPAAERGTLDTLISQTRRLRGGVDAVRRVAAPEDDDVVADPQRRWQRALCDLAVHQLDDVGQQLDQLRDGLPPEPSTVAYAPVPVAPPEAERAAPCRAGSAEWNLLTDEVEWSSELYTIFDRTSGEGPLSLDELPTWLFPDDQLWMMEAVTDCLVDGKPIDGEFRIVRQDSSVRTLHMVAEPVLGSDGSTVSMWAVLRDVSELRRSERAVRETRDSLQHQRHIARTEHRLAVELQEAVLPPWRGSLRFPHGDARTTGTLDLAAHYLPSATSALIGGDWYDALELPDGGTLLTVGDLTGHGVEATSGMAMLLGAVRGMAVAGVMPGALMGHLNQLLDAAVQPALGSALCCHYEPRTRTLTWAQAGHPAPLLYRSGAGRPLPLPEGVLLGATSGAVYGERTEQLLPGDLLVLHTDGLAPRSADVDAEEQSGATRLLGLAPRFAAARTARECVRAVIEEFGDTEREDDACALVARVCA
ncbi:PP2C family protein-serine/threonine phosphatase [Streptomyces gobiensis]|uniref:PP2C family protein-serine/threonine phosphatase n=1 Tax=Streptomyces gobiensis TaxID=2875706 RepID=UPI001E3BBE96|nr:SpoIIE family protein phosphatase [Streptomyces gobiensis]UGY94755.1 SpoIIE family protein phosphatase [Streptomyces gobiensis]